MLSLAFIDFVSSEILRAIPKFPYYMIDVFIIIMPTIGYLDQIRIMLMTHSSSAYSMNTALILLSSNGMKVLFWFFEPFAANLFAQSIALYLVQVVLTLIFFKLSSPSVDNFPFSTTRTIGPRLRMPEFVNFRKYMNIYRSQSFFDFMFSVSIYSFFVCAAFFAGNVTLGVHTSVEIISIIANVIDSAVSIPLFHRVVINGSIVNASLVLVLQYFFGDIVKILIFKASKSPWPFMLGGFIQLTLDTIVLFVYFWLLHKAGGQADVKNESGSEQAQSKAARKSSEDIHVREAAAINQRNLQHPPDGTEAK